MLIIQNSKFIVIVQSSSFLARHHHRNRHSAVDLVAVTAHAVCHVGGDDQASASCRASISSERPTLKRFTPSCSES